MLRLMAVYEDERERLGRPQVRHPLRREIVPGRTTDEAFARFECDGQGPADGLRAALARHPRRR